MSNSKKRNSKSSEASLAKQLVAGIGKHMTNVASVTLLGATMTPAEVAKSLETFAALRSDAEAAKANATTKVAAENAHAPALRALMDAFMAVVKAAYGTQADVLADFGLPPKRARTPLTAEQQALSNAKRKATRAARHTQGRKQKAAIKGNVTGLAIATVVQPAAAPEASAAPPAPVPSNTK